MSRKFGKLTSEITEKHNRFEKYLDEESFKIRL